MTTSVSIVPGATGLDAWRAVYFGARIELARDCRAGVEAAATVIERIVAQGMPVYGVNTGFGKLANVSIDAADLSKLQRNLVLSHCSGVGEPLPTRVVRLVLALKIAALAQGASGVRWDTVEQLLACLQRGLLPAVKGAGDTDDIGRMLN